MAAHAHRNASTAPATAGSTEIDQTSTAETPLCQPLPGLAVHAVGQQPGAPGRPAGGVGALRRVTDSRGLPESLRGGIEQLAGVRLDDVRVHRDSDEPARIGAAAFTRGADIHLGPGSAQELAHEAWHVVQQRQGRVRGAGSVAGHSVNDHPALEREADEMGARAAHQAGLPGLAPDPRRAPAAAPGRDAAAGSGAPLQARWLFLDAESAPSKGYFWEVEGGVRQEDVPAPTRWSAEYPLLATPSSATYYKPGARIPRSASKSLSPALTDEQFTEKYGKAKASSSSDHYNPFGRFSSSVSVKAFIPRIGLHAPEAFQTDLMTRDDTFEAVAERGPANSSGFPGQVRTTGGHLLGLVQVDQLGAYYADVDPTPANAAHDPKAVDDPAKLGLKPAPVEPTVLVASGEGATHTSHVKAVQASRIDAAVLKQWDGVKRSQQQAQVMGCSAAEAAANAGYNGAEGEGWEWLHLISHGMGGADRIGPQHADNLVVGTSECNTQMIVIEEVLKDLVKRYDLKARLSVFADLSDPVRHIARQITYDFMFQEPGGKGVQVFHWFFDPLSRSKPAVAQNLLARLVARYHLGDTKTFAMPKSETSAFTGSASSSSSSSSSSSLSSPPPSSSSSSSSSSSGAMDTTMDTASGHDG